MSDTVLPVPAEWRARALMTKAQYDAAYAAALADPDGYWRQQAGRLNWLKPFTKVSDVSYDPANLHIKWFEDGALNLAAKSIDLQ
jgi:acetyl-CoA synthetase